jgi:hypothetical protein
MKRVSVVLSCALLLALPTGALAAAMQDEPVTTTTTATSTTPAASDNPSWEESVVAALAILGAIALGGGVVWMVVQAHKLEQELARATLRQGGSISTQETAAAGSAALLAAARVTAAVPGGAAAPAIAPRVIRVSGPDAVHVNLAGEYTVDKEVASPEWAVRGIDSYAQALKRSGHTFVFTPQQEASDVAVTVTSADGNTGQHSVNVLPAVARSSFAVRLAIRNWGLVVVAIVIVFGAIALGVTGHLDGGNFVALVTPLAALLGIAAATSGGSGSGDSAAGGTAGGAAGGAGGAPGGGA